MEILEKLLGGGARVRVMRLFLLNPEQVFESKEIAKRSMVKRPSLRRELSVLEKTRFLKKKGKGYVMNTEFKYYIPMRDLLIGTEFLRKEELEKRFKPAGRVSLLLAAGIFINDPKSRLDLLIVGDRLKKGILEKIVKSIEADIGKELSYAVFDNADYVYRLSMYDKLVRDVLDFPHEVIIDKKLSTSAFKNKTKVV